MSVEVGGCTLAALFLAGATWTDVETRRVPRWLSLPFGAAGLGLLVMGGGDRWRWVPLLAAGAALAAAALEFPAGDAEAAAVVALLSPAAVTVAALLVALPLGMLARRYLWRPDTVPLLPAMACGWVGGLVAWGSA